MKYKDMKIKSKLLLGFCLVIILCIALSTFALYTLNKSNTSYENLLGFSQQRLKYILSIETNVMDIRRITTAINAYTGNAERQEGYKTESANIVESINNAADYYIQLAKSDVSLTQAEINDIVTKAESLKTVLAEYKTKLIDPNILSAIANDKAAVVANASAQAPLITTLSTTIIELAQYEENLTETLSTAVAAQEGRSRLVFIAITIAIVALSLLTAFTISGVITKPIKVMEGFLHQIDKTGNLTFSEDEWKTARQFATGKDEMAQSLAAFLKMLEQFIYYGQCLETVAARDLTSEITIVSDSDTCGVALMTMQNTLNDLFEEIRTASSQVAAGSSQVAQAAQNLASGATEQAATIQQITASVVDLREKANENARVATGALSEVGEVSTLMNECSHAMDSMLRAMQDISEKSKNISRVIKVIDDIAFQTNILALNAAVEAARAGQHGKGFAVVAEEVRNLASKSAQAASETAVLIESSLQSVADGSLVVEKVNKGLQSVAEISGTNAISIDKLHQTSEVQSKAMAEVAYAISQVSSVVQANTATSEEAAASSEEMSSQSAILDEVIGRFKIKTTGLSTATSKAQNPVGLLGNTEYVEPDLLFAHSKY